MKALFTKVLRYFRHGGVRKVDAVLSTLQNAHDQLDAGHAAIQATMVANGNEVVRAAKKHDKVVQRSLSRYSELTRTKTAENNDLAEKARQARAVQGKISDLLK